jgi:spore coat protein U-like protein
VSCRLTVFTLGAVLWLAMAQPAQAACTVSATPVAFGPYDVFALAHDDAVGSITYRCTFLEFNIRVSISRGSSSTFSPRTLRSGGEQLAYNIFRDSARTQIWGDGTGGTAVYSVVIPPWNQDVVLTMYGRVPAEQDAMVGSYTDTVVVTVEF